MNRTFAIRIFTLSALTLLFVQIGACSDPQDEGCSEGWTGSSCNECDVGFFGEACEPCDCTNRACDDGIEGNGECGVCEPGWMGDDCDVCATGFMGDACDQCAEGFVGESCDECIEGHYGQLCQPCLCDSNGICDDGMEGAGRCLSCDAGWTGELCDEVDSDSDGFPDIEDPFPNDSAYPVPAAPNVVFAHTGDTLYSFNPENRSVAEVGAFTDSVTHDPLLYITDIALDQWNILYAVSYDVLYVCDGQTVSCTKIATLNDNFNAFTLVRRGVVHQDREALVLISDAGEWSWVELGDGTATLHTMGFYGSDYESVGDAFSVNKMGTFGAVRKDGVTGTIIVSCDPQTGEALSEIITLPDEYNRVFGLAGWDGEVFAFDASGSILSVNVSANTWEEVAVTAFYWWGAGTSTAAAY